MLLSLSVLSFLHWFVRVTCGKVSHWNSAWLILGSKIFNAFPFVPVFDVSVYVETR